MRLLLLYAAALACFAQDGADLVGRWRSLATSKGGIGAMYEFHPNGTVDFSPGAIVEMKFRREANQIFLTAPGEAEAPSKLAWTPEGHLRLGMGGAFEEYRRIGSAAEAGKLTGEWLGERNMDGIRVSVRWVFSGDTNGSALLLIAFKTEAGNYVVKSGGIGASFSGGGTMQGTYTVKDGVLSLTRSGARVQRFGRY